MILLTKLVSLLMKIVILLMKIVILLMKIVSLLMKLVSLLMKTVILLMKLVIFLDFLEFSYGIFYKDFIGNLSSKVNSAIERIYSLFLPSQF